MTEEIPAKDYEFVEKIAYKYFLRSSYYVELNDLVQEGLLAYVKVKEKYVEAKNSFFMGYAYLRVSGAIKDYIGKNSPRGGATVRPNSVTTTREMYNFSSIGIDENDFEDTLSSTVEDELIRQQCMDEFNKYLSTITSFEQRILYDYFILQLSIVKISENTKISRIKIKKILMNCLVYLKSFFEVEENF